MGGNLSPPEAPHGPSRGRREGTSAGWVARPGGGGWGRGLRALLLAGACGALLCSGDTPYTCIGGDFEVNVGGSSQNHLERRQEGFHKGKTAPCGINKIYTAYEDRDLGDGNRHGSLWGGANGLSCTSAGRCTGEEQREPVQLLGTDSHGCCCSSGLSGLGLGPSVYAWTIATVQRYKECDSTLQFYPSPGNPMVAGACGPTVCQFEITALPEKGTVYTAEVNKTRAPTGALGGCTDETPCVVQPVFRDSFPGSSAAALNLPAAFVGVTGRWETNKVIFAPFPGDVGRCTGQTCVNQFANLYSNFDASSGQYIENWKYAQLRFKVRSFTWKYTHDDGTDVEFVRSSPNFFPERIEDAYNKWRFHGLYQPFAVEACPCILSNAITFTFTCGTTLGARPCSQQCANCPSPGTTWSFGRQLMLDFERMKAVDVGVVKECACADPLPVNGNRCGTGGPCWTKAEREWMSREVASGCAATGRCFQINASGLPGPCYSDCTGHVYDIKRVETGVSAPLIPNQTSTQDLRIVPYNDRPSVGGGGASLRFDGIDDMAASTVNHWPTTGMTVMLWVKGSRSLRPNQGLLQFMSARNGLELQIYNTENLEVYLRGATSGPTGINVNSDNKWHHVAVTWTSAERYVGDNSRMPAGQVRVYVDCGFTPYRADPRFSQSTDASLIDTAGGAKFYCSSATGVQYDATTGPPANYAAWTGTLSPGTVMSNDGEVSIGQRMSCNVTTREKEVEIERILAMQKNNTFCRRNIRPACNITFNSTPSSYIPGIYSPQGDCTETVLGVHLSSGGDNFSSCVYNATDPYTTIKHHPASRLAATHWMWSNDVYPTSGTEGPYYSMPYVTETQQQLRMQTKCVGGCYDAGGAFLGYMDELRVYDYPMSFREIGFVNSDTVRDGINCINKYMEDAGGARTQGVCSHMIDEQYKRGLKLYFPFDDPWSLYNANSDSSGVYPGAVVFNSAEKGTVSYGAIGNYDSGLGYAMRLGGDFHSTAPVFVPSTAPVYGARNDFYYYPTGTLHLIQLYVRDWDTCVNVENPLHIASDAFTSPQTCSDQACYDSHCTSLLVRLKKASPSGSPAVFGTIYRSRVRDQCVARQGGAICAPFPECIGEKCFEASAIRMGGQGPALNVDKFYIYSGEWIDEYPVNIFPSAATYQGLQSLLTANGKMGKVTCGLLADGGCPNNAFILLDGAPSLATPHEDSFTGYSVQITLGDRIAYSNIICHGNQICDPANSLPAAGQVVTLEPALPFALTSDCQYRIFRGKYSLGFYLHYHSTLVGGGGAGADVLHFEVKDIPGEAGTQVSKVFPTSSQQELLIESELNLDDLSEIAAWNQPQMEGTILIAAMSTPVPTPSDAVLAEDKVGIIELDFVLDDDEHRRGFNVTANGPQHVTLNTQGSGTAGTGIYAPGEMYHAMEVHCGVVKETANCHQLHADQMSLGGKEGGGGVTYCDDDSYVNPGESLYQKLVNSHPTFRELGLVSITCMYNSNRTEIYNVTGYNYTCLPPCEPTLFTYQILAEGCNVNCSLVRLAAQGGPPAAGVICRNTYGLYPNELNCNGGDNNGYVCAGAQDISTCQVLGAIEFGFCQGRDLQRGIAPDIPDLKNSPHIIKDDPATMVHAVMHGDVYFVDWLHRGAQVVWNEVAVDTAAGLGYNTILRYLIRNGCPWRSSAIDAAYQRGWTEAYQFLSSLLPPKDTLVGKSPTCGCAELSLFKGSAVNNARCFPYATVPGTECFQRCGLTEVADTSCTNGNSFWLDDHEDVRNAAGYFEGIINPSVNAKDDPLNPNRAALAYTRPATTRCPGTGAARAIIRGPRINYLETTLNTPGTDAKGAREWDGSRLGFSAQSVICTDYLPRVGGMAPQKFCFPPQSYITAGANFDFLNYHIADPKLRVVYIPPPDASGTHAVFNVTSSRVTEFPKETMGPQPGTNWPTDAKLAGHPIGARISKVNIVLKPTDDRPTPSFPPRPLTMTEDRVTILKLGLTDPDTALGRLRAYITKFPANGRLYQVKSATKTLNTTFEPALNITAYAHNPASCITRRTICEQGGACDCSSGSCDEPLENCYYTKETFVLGEPITADEVTLVQRPAQILNSTSAYVVNASEMLPRGLTSKLLEKYIILNGSALGCYRIDRVEGEDAQKWSGEPHCDFEDQQIFPSSCRRCTAVPNGNTAPIPTGAWSGHLLYEPVHVQRYAEGIPLNAPHDPSHGGQCTLRELCELGANTASKAACVPWEALDSNGRPMPNIRPPGLPLDPRHDPGEHISPPISNYGAVPCDSAAGGVGCSRGGAYVWPRGFEPVPETEETPYRNVNLTQFGDPVDDTSFYATCGTRGVRQVRATYETPVYMTGFRLSGLSLQDDIRMRVLARTSVSRVDRVTESFEVKETVKVRLSEEGQETVKQVIATSYKVKTREYQTGCGGGEWREVWRGLAYDGKIVGGKGRERLYGRELEDSEMSLNFPGVNFTTSELMLEVCGLSGLGPSNNDGGNPLEGLEGLLLVGTRNTPKGLITDEEFRVAFAPNPHFSGTDTFHYRGEDTAPACTGLECVDRSNLREKAVGISVPNSNDPPFAPRTDVTAGVGQKVVLDLAGSDALIDAGTFAWQDLSLVDQAMYSGGYPYRILDLFGKPDGEPDTDLTAQITQQPDKGTLEYKGGTIYEMTVPEGDGGAPYASLTFSVTDPQGIVSPDGVATITILCPKGQHILQEERRCLDCPRGQYNPRDSARVACLPCPTGHFTSATRSTACEMCPAGTFAPMPGSPECKLCEPGTFNNIPGSVGCVPCPRGTTAPRFGSTVCGDCGSLAYSPIIGAPRCFDCPALSRSSSLQSTNAGNCECVFGSYQKAIFDPYVYQPWSRDGWGTANGSEVAPAIPGIADPWPLRLSQVSANCTACPDGAHCHGKWIAPVALSGHWTSWTDRDFWDDSISPRFSPCNDRNIREVCLGYPLLDITERYEICRYRTNYGVCDIWPLDNYSAPQDPLRCKQGYEGTLCAKCVGHEVKRCVPKASDADEGWFWHKQSETLKGQASFLRTNFTDCYAIGDCEGVSGEECAARETACWADDACRWDTARYYRAYDGFCTVCPLPVTAFIIYIVWFAAYGALIVLILRLALSDMISFQITFTFWQCAAVLARYRVPWPPLAQSTLAGFSIANVNLDGFPWKCFFDSAPSYRDLWYLTVFVPPGAMAIAVVRWLLPFLTVPPSGKALMRMFKSAMSRRDNFKGTGTVVRSQYVAGRRPPTDALRPSTRESRGSTASLLRPASQMSGQSSGGGGGMTRPDGTIAPIQPFADFSRKAKGSTKDGKAVVMPGRLGGGEGSWIDGDGTGSVRGSTGHSSARGSSRGLSRGSGRRMSQQTNEGDLRLEEITMDPINDSQLGASGASGGTDPDSSKETIAAQNFGSPSKGRADIRREASLGLDDIGGGGGGGRSTSVFVPRRPRSAHSHPPTHLSTRRPLQLDTLMETSPDRPTPSGPVLATSAPLPGEIGAGVAGGLFSTLPPPPISHTSVRVSGSRFGGASSRKLEGGSMAPIAEGGGEGDERGEGGGRASTKGYGAVDAKKAMGTGIAKEDMLHTTEHVQYPLHGVAGTQGPDLLILDEVGDVSAMSRPTSQHSRKIEAAATYTRPSSRVGTGRSVTFPLEAEWEAAQAGRYSRPETGSTRGGGSRPGTSGVGSRPGTGGSDSYRKPRTPNRGIEFAQIEATRLATPSRLQRAKEGYRDWELKNPTQAHTPRMEQRGDSFKSTGSSKEISIIPDIGVAWYVRKQYFDLAWRACVAILTFMYVMAASKTMEPFKWTFLSVNKAVLDTEPSVSLFDSFHTEVFPIALFAMPAVVASPVAMYFFIYVGYKRRVMDEPSFGMRWGYLLDPFERKHWYWGLVIAGRKFLFVFARIFLMNDLYMQKFLPAFYIVGNLIANYHIRPYRLERHNVLENVLQLCLLVLILLMLVSPLDITLYHDNRGRSQAGPLEFQITGGVQFVQLVSIVSAMVCIYADVIDAQLYMPWYIRWVWNLVGGPIFLVLGIIRRIIYKIILLIYRLLKRKPPTNIEEGATSKKKFVFNPNIYRNHETPVISGRPYADILWEQVTKLKTKAAGNVLPEFEDPDDDLVKPDDGAQWLKDRFAIHKRVFLIEKRLVNEAFFDAKSVRILRGERELSVALDAAVEQLQREYDELYDQLYDAQATFEALGEDHAVEMKKYEKEQEALEDTMDRVRFSKAKLDSTIRRVGQPEDWRRRFLEEQARRHALEQEIVELQVQVDKIRLDKQQKGEDSDDSDEEEEQ